MKKKLWSWERGFEDWIVVREMNFFFFVVLFFKIICIRNIGVFIRNVYDQFCFRRIDFDFLGLGYRNLYFE